LQDFCLGECSAPPQGVNRKTIRFSGFFSAIHLKPMNPKRIIARAAGPQVDAAAKVSVFHG